MSDPVKATYQFLALIFLLCGCSSVRDSSIKQKVVGAWVMQQPGIPTRIIYHPDGTWEAMLTPNRSDYSFSYDGTWEVKNGFIIKTTSKRTEERYPDSEFGIEHLKIIRIDDGSLILSSSDVTNLLKKL